ncbi:hypothetical protein FOL47_002740 [Perkinsus chesapeaki]|uniref:KIN17 C2H2-type zinc finger domain-containing protein n=1 Tax=Perkinsus chesapeaki TaxID=330153 RepID=A0A7J6MBU1_PERCH|nr:hypothetical protein FOL47_002740 [Perkinsus chesapeaki]
MGKGRAEKWSPKWLDNKMKAKGLQKLKWYCQMCQKQCRDENGFKCHRTGKANIEKTERGWYLEYIDRERMEREAKYKEEKKYEAAEEKQEERLIAKQVRMAKAEAMKSGIKDSKATTLERKEGDNDIIELGVTNLIDAKRNIKKGITLNKVVPKNINILEEAAIKAENDAKKEAELWMKMEEEDDDIIDIPSDVNDNIK